jgi:hypothetical protein
MMMTRQSWLEIRSRYWGDWWLIYIPFVNTLVFSSMDCMAYGG